MTLTPRPKTYCSQCKRELKHVVFSNVKNIVCKDCYGLDRYREVGGPAFEEERGGDLTPKDTEVPDAT
ncbi:MAG: hypothetical protein GW893_00410 [Armatimonadetes bacterium]|nr:hypothetical protein [Armatimonadota bacterium]PIU62363.1 MAG: hypothetical protein COS85_18745 [Armatimonadetes bacterium CG07_land_8_20_14_0_80_59_28]PIX45033.1 MAG: hypothetical protein COZ56_02935 [Armatimonadetes bacterium CG_4_8_14_3_um_filter_58_9]PIY40818.1 MAG: hypothetical protein COZ05_16750 [Armatimonadetes bacterium CG_4_10_14_3_um_filter_59_10]PJB74318.1 MAG: hypothetical protein CO095_04905 [Armatimonadetes bacterium CG_4_9_14_3_um_filter_58_7]